MKDGPRRGTGVGGEGYNSGNILEMELLALPIKRMKGRRQSFPVLFRLELLWAVQATARQV